MTNSNENYTGTDLLEILKEAVNYNQFIINDLRAQLKPVGRLLDYGAGIGTFAEYLQTPTLKISCFEPDPKQSQLLRKNGFSSYQSLAEVPQNHYRYVYSLNVLEHIEDDQKALNDLYALMADQGELYLYVPAFNILFSSMDKKVGHFRRYTKGDLLPKLSKAGFEIKKAYYADSLGFFASIAFKLLGNKSGEVNLASVKIYDRFLFPLSRLCDVVCQHFFGKNLVVICKKNKFKSQN